MEPTFSVYSVIVNVCYLHFLPFIDFIQVTKEVFQV